MEFQVQLKKTKKKAKNKKAVVGYDFTPDFFEEFIRLVKRFVILEACNYINDCLRSEDEKKDD